MKFVRCWSEASVFNSRAAAKYWADKALRNFNENVRALSGVGYLKPGKYVAYIYGKGWVQK